MHADTGTFKAVQPSPLTAPRRGTCPTCARSTTFEVGGEQQIPEQVARAAGLPMVMKLYHCDSCRSTLSEQDIAWR